MKKNIDSFVSWETKYVIKVQKKRCFWHFVKISEEYSASFFFLKYSMLRDILELKKIVKSDKYTAPNTIRQEEKRWV